jgi:hypothetical protein
MTSGVRVAFSAADITVVLCEDCAETAQPVQRLATDRKPTDWCSSPGSQARPLVGLTQPPIQCVSRVNFPVREADHSTPTSTNLTNTKQNKLRCV